MSLAFFTADERPELREGLSGLVEMWPRFVLTPVAIDREADLGTYVEPNVWMHTRSASRRTL